MNFISQMPFQDRFQNIFIVGSTSSLFILPENFNNFGVISRRHSQHLKIEVEFFLKSCPFSRKFAVLARWLSYQIVTSGAIIFTHPEYFRSCFSSEVSGGLHFRIFLRSKFSNPFSDYSIFIPFRSSPYSSGVLLFNQFAISSFSCL